MSLPRTKALVGAFVVLVLVPTLVAAVFSDSDPVAANAFAASNCFRARVNSVQTGEVTTSAAGTATVTITAVDTTQSFLLLTVRSDADEPPDNIVTGRIADSTTLEIERLSDGAPPPDVVVRWNVVEYACGVSVQRGTVAGNGLSTLDIPISSAPTTQSFPLVNFAPDGTTGILSADDLVAARLTSDTTLRLEAGSLRGSASYDWQVVSFDNASDASVQTVDLTLTGGSDVVAASALGQAVEPSRTLIVAGSTIGAALTPDEALVSVDLGDGTSVAATRASAGAVSEDVSAVIHVVELAEGTSVQHGEVTLTGAEATADVAIVPVTTATTTVHSTSFSAGDGSYGRSNHSADDNIGEGQATFEITTSSNLRITRAATTSTATFNWQVVEWGGPGWWSPSYEFRRQVVVSASALQDAPDGYSTPVTFDHAQMVTDGLSLSSGDDIRVLHFDGSTWTELDRVLDEGSAWNASDTTLWFMTEAAVAAGVADGSYWIYFGNDSAGTPPADPAAVYLVVDDFEDGDLVEYDQPSLPSDWYTEDTWTRRRTLTISSAQVDADLTDFPVLVALTDASMAPNVQADGDDLAVALTDGTQIPHELVSWNDVTGELVMWVRVPLVSSSVDTDLHLWFGNPTVQGQEQPDLVWQPDHDAAWHLEESPAGTMSDSTVWDRDATASGGMTGAALVSAQVGSGISFDGSDDRIRAGTSPARATEELTVSGWVDLASASEDHRYVTRADPSGNVSWSLGRDQASGQVRSSVTLASLATVDADGPATLIAGSGWHHVALTWDGSQLTTYLDGVPGTAVAGSGQLRRELDHQLTIGSDPDGSNGDPVTIDEVRVSSTARSTAWIAAEYRNQSTPGTFVSAGPVTVATWTPAWPYRKTILLASAAVPSSQSDIVVPVEIDVDAELAANAGVGDVLVTDTDGTTLLPYWVERFDPTTGALRIWVRVPTVDGASDTTLFLYYGSTLESSREDRDATWSGYDAVWTLTG